MTFWRPWVWLSFWTWAILSLIKPIRATDVWWQLASGRYILSHKWIPTVDVFSLTCRGRSWIDYEWLYQVLLFLSYRVAALAGVTLFHIAWIVAALYFVMVRFRDAAVPTIGVVLAMTIIFAACAPGWTERADLLSIAFVSALMCSLEKVRRGLASPNSLWPWLGLNCLWANLHPAFILGFIMVMLYGIEFIRTGQWGKGQAVVWILCMILVTLINPYGLLLWKQIVRALSLTSVADQNEHLPPPWAHMRIFWIAFLLHALLLARSRERKIHVPWIGWIMTLSFGYAAARNARYVPFFLITAFPFAIQSAFQGWKFKPLAAAWERPSYYACVSAVFIMLICVQLPRISLGTVSEKVPVGVCNFVVAHQLKGRFYNDFDFGSYWIWRFDGSPAVFVDGRSPTVQGYAELRQEIRRAQGGPADGWQAFLNKYGITAVLIRVPPMEVRQSVLTSYFPKNTWTLVYSDPLALLFLKRERRRVESDPVR